jgi:hypothetical protein
MDGIDAEHEFDGRSRPEEDELLKITGFEDVYGLSTAVENPLQIQAFDPNEHSIDQIKGLFSGYVENGVTTVLIQVFEHRRVLTRGGVLSIILTNNTFHRMSDAGLSLDTKLLAILKGGTLKFGSFHMLRRVFDVNELFQKATDQDLQAFAQKPILFVADLAKFLTDADQVIRRKIGFILQSGVLGRHTAAELKRAAAQFGIVLTLDAQQKIALPPERAALKKILKFLDEDYFESALSKTKFISNSKRVMD